MAPDVAVVVPTYRRPDLLADLLDALAEQTLPPSRWELIVVDNGSHDPVVGELLRELPARVPCATQVLTIESNRGPAPARNLGWRATSAPLVAFVDDDVRPEPEWLERGIDAMTDSKVGVVQGRTRAPLGSQLEREPAWTIWQVIDGPTAFFEACNIFYRREALEATGGFDESIGWWGEDSAAGWRVLEAGWARDFAPDAVVEHPVVVRGAMWHIRNGWREGNNVLLAARFPAFRRDAFWRPWAFRKRDAAFVLAVVSGVAALRWRPAALGVLPYLWIGRPGRGHYTVRVCAETVVVDAVRTSAHLVGAVRHRVLVV